MDVIYFLIPLALLLLLAAIAAFLWAVKNNQFDNLDREAYRILFDEDQVKSGPKSAQGEQSPTETQPDKQNEQDASTRPDGGLH